MAEASNVKFKLFRVQIHGAQIFHEHVDAVFSLAARGHLVSPKVEIKPSGELRTRASNLAFDLVDVEGLERHGPAGQEVKLREILGEKIGIFSVDVIPPFDGTSLLFDDADGVVVLHTGEGQVGNDDLNGFLALVGAKLVDGGDERLGFFLLGHGFPNVMEHSLEDAHDVVVVGPRTFNVEGDEFSKVAVGVAFLGSKRRTDFENPLQATAHAELLEQLRGLVEECGPVKVLHGKQVCASFGCGGDDLWRVCFDKPFFDEVLSSKLQHLPTKPEHGVDVGASEVEEPIVEAGVQLHLDVVRYAQRQRGFGSSDHLNRRGQDLVRWRRGRFAFLDLGWALQCNGSGELQRGFSGHALNGVEGFLSDVVGFEEDLRLAGSVSKVNETNRALPSVGLHEATNGDVASNQIGAVGLQFAECVRSEGGGYPGGHGLCGRAGGHEGFA